MQEVEQNSKERDFELIFQKVWEYSKANFPEGLTPNVIDLVAKSVVITWNDQVEPRDKQIAALQEEIRQLKNNKQ